MIKPSPPSALKLLKKKNYHGIEKLDNYEWLRSDKWQEVMRDPQLLEPEIKKHLDAENAYTDAILAPLNANIENLYEEMKLRVKEEDSLSHARWELVLLSPFSAWWTAYFVLSPSTLWRRRALVI